MPSKITGKQKYEYVQTYHSEHYRAQNGRQIPCKLKSKWKQISQKKLPQMIIVAKLTR